MNVSSSQQETRKSPLWGSITAFVLGLFIGLTFLAQSVEPFTDDNRTGALVIAIFAVIFAAIALAAGHRSKIMASVGLVLGIIGIIMYLPS